MSQQLPPDGQSTSQQLRTLSDVLAVLRAAGVAKLGWLYYKSSDKSTHDQEWVEDANAEYVRVLPRCDEIFETLWNITALVGANYGEYVLDVIAGELRCVGSAYEIVEIRTDPIDEEDQWVLRETDTPDPEPDADEGTGLSLATPQPGQLHCADCPQEIW